MLRVVLVIGNYENFGVFVINRLLENIRSSRKKFTRNMHIVISLAMTLLGFVLGIMQEYLDSIAFNSLPTILQAVDIVNYFGRISIWIFLATIISIYAESPLRAAINTFLFLFSMVVGYFLYSKYILDFLPRNYIMIWIFLSFASFFLAYICRFAKGDGIIAMLISSLIMGVLFAQAINLNFSQGFYIYNYMDLFTWLVAVIILHREWKEYIFSIALSFIIAFICQRFIPY